MKADFTSGGLTAREFSVLRLMAQGCSNEAVASELGLAVKTVESAIRSIFQRLRLPDDPSVNRRVLAVRWCIEQAEDSPQAVSRSWSPLIGRVSELDQLAMLLDANQLVSIVGAGGMGKTRLATEIATRRSSDQVIMIDLTGCDDSTARLRVFERFGLRALNEPHALRIIRRMLDAKAYLVVLDNVEHVAMTVASLIPVLTTSETRLVVTSRRPLDISGEFVWRVPPLNEQDSIELFERRLVENGCPAGTERPVMARWCTALGGMPLAIELAASRLATRPLDDLEYEHDELPELLRRAGGSHASSLDEVLSDSFRRLPAESRDLARSLAPLRGGFTLETVRAVGGMNDVELAISSLVRSGFVELGPTRYRMLEPIRQFVAAHTTATNRVAAARGLVAWAVHFAESADVGYAHEPIAWYRRIDAERDNLDLALDAAVSLGAAVEAMTIVRGMAPYWLASASPTAYERAEAAISDLELPRSTSGWGWTSIALGRLAAEARNPRAATFHFTEALDCFELVGDTAGIAAAACWKARVERSRNDLLMAIRLAADAGSPEVEGWARLTLARDDMRAIGDHTACLLQLDRAMQLAHLHDYPLLGYNSSLLRAEIMLQGNWLGQSAFPEDEIVRLLDDAGRFSRQLTAAVYVNDVLSVTTTCHLHYSRWDLARQSIIAQLEFSQRTEDCVVVAEAVLMAAVLLFERGHRALARRLTTEAGPTFADWSKALWLAHTLYPANDLYAEVGDHSSLSLDELVGLADAALDAVKGLDR